jgi:hypothetical protein
MRLGYAWCLDRAGRIGEAIPLYRRIIADAWATEGKARSAGEFPGWQAVTAEAAGYLIPHLDPAKDAAELATLRGRLDQLIRLPRPITPIVVPLDDRATPAAIVDESADVRFDLDGSGRRDPWQWITPRAGWLVYDHAGAGGIDSGLQLFGSVTFWLFWSHGYEAMRALDDDGDGRLAGSELRHLALWVDADGDGRSDPGEVRALQDHGVVVLSTRFVEGGGPSVAAWSPHGVTLADGRTRPTFDILLRRAPASQSTALSTGPNAPAGDADDSGAAASGATSSPRISAPPPFVRW